MKDAPERWNGFLERWTVRLIISFIGFAHLKTHCILNGIYECFIGVSNIDCNIEEKSVLVTHEDSVTGEQIVEALSKVRQTDNVFLIKHAISNMDNPFTSSLLC